MGIGRSQKSKVKSQKLRKPIIHYSLFTIMVPMPNAPCPMPNTRFCHDFLE
ncbi:MAG: hypothetical protein F6J93_24385 [Oscillatoria sp. SIO1A7]|nr:hypothetical protein [Oscillatoria sp. SIO1A7]